MQETVYAAGSQNTPLPKSKYTNTLEHIAELALESHARHVVAVEARATIPYRVRPVAREIQCVP